MTFKCRIRAFVLFIPVAIASTWVVSPLRADEFYAGKTINLYIGFPPGGGYDLYGRLLARHLGSHIPGNPSIVTRNMPGAGGLAVINYMVNVAPRDGTSLAIATDGIVVEQLLAQTGISYDASKLNWIGRFLPTAEVFVTWHTSPTKTLEDARRRETILSSSGSGITDYLPRALNLYAGTRFKVIAGYPGGVEQILAMERGEVEGAPALWTDIKNRKSDWLTEKKISVLVIGSNKRSPDIPHVPTVSETGITEDGRAVLSLLSSGDIGRAVFTAPGVPSVQVKRLREAFLATIADPAFIEDSSRSKLDLEPLGGEQLQDVVAKMLAFPESLVKAARAARRH